jgi:antitoxin ParD1/3/4
MGMNINLTPQLEEMIRQKVDSGMYNSASEVVRDALQLLDEKDRLRAAKLDRCGKRFKRGLGSPATAWDREEIKRKGRAKRATKSRTAKA